MPRKFASVPIRIMAKFKKNEGDTAIYRPLSLYTSLEAKTLISLATGYLSSMLDKHLHREILSYRPKREYHGQKHYATDGNDAIIGLRKFADDHRGQHIYVAECDIQKFFDIINHDVVLKCFADIASEAGLPDYHQVERILKAYLDSYSFQKDVMNLNHDENYWSRYQKNTASHGWMTSASAHVMRTISSSRHAGITSAYRRAELCHASSPTWSSTAWTRQL